jgi:hypothetical protein
MIEPGLWRRWISGLLLLVAACAGQPTAALIPAAAPTLTPTQASLTPPPPGIVYRSDEGTFITLQGGSRQQLSEPGGQVEAGAASPDGRFRLVSEDGRQILVDLGEGQRVEIWPRGGLNLCPFAWVWAQPALLYTTLLPEGAYPELGCARGSPALLDPQSQALTLLDEAASGLGGLAISPDGRRMAYDLKGAPWLVTFSGQSSRLEAAPMDLAQLTGLSLPNIRLADPAWSPSGELLAWTFHTAGAEAQGGVVVLDLAGGAAQRFTPFDVSRGESHHPQLIFSPAGTHLILRHYRQEAGLFASPVLALADGSIRTLEGFFSQWSPAGGWLLVEKSLSGDDPCRLAVESPDGAQRLPICRGDQAWWSPDEKLLLTWPYNREAFWVTHLASGELIPVDLPPGVHILSWEPVP